MLLNALYPPHRTLGQFLALHSGGAHRRPERGGSGSQTTISLDDSGGNDVDAKTQASSSLNGTTSADNYTEDSFQISGVETVSNGTSYFNATTEDDGLQSYSEHDVVGSYGVYATVDQVGLDCFSADDEAVATASGSGGSGNLTPSMETLTRDDYSYVSAHATGTSPNPWDATHTTTADISTLSTNNAGISSATTTTDETIHDHTSATLDEGGNWYDYLATVHEVVSNGGTPTVSGPWTWTNSSWMNGADSLSCTSSGDLSQPPDPPPAPGPPPAPSWFESLGLDKAADAVVGGLDKVTGGLSTQALNSKAFGAVVDGYDQFYAGTATRLTGGLTDRMRASMYGQTATKNHQGTLYSIGQGVGTGLGLAIGFGNPCAMSGAVGIGLKGINMLQAVGGSINAYENYQKDNMLGAALDALGVLGNVATMLKACFAARTPLLTLEGSEYIENIREGDYVLSRDENDADGPVVARQVEEVFTSYAKIWHVHVGGQVIRTTAEHPFWVRGKGWTAGWELRVGDKLSSHDGRWVTVEDLLDTGEWETVYNLRVIGYATYFVGCLSWGFSVWRHNSCHVVEIDPGVGMKRVGPRLTTRQAIAAAKEGENIAASSVREARQVAQAVAEAGKVVEDTERVLENGLRIPGHFHPLFANGDRMPIHIYYP